MGRTTALYCCGGRLANEPGTQLRTGSRCKYCRWRAYLCKWFQRWVALQWYLAIEKCYDRFACSLPNWWFETWRFTIGVAQLEFTYASTWRFSSTICLLELPNSSLDVKVWVRRRRDVPAVARIACESR